MWPVLVEVDPRAEPVVVVRAGLEAIAENRRDAVGRGAVISENYRNARLRTLVSANAATVGPPELVAVRLVVSP
jgi:hypothetical protein